MAHSPQSSITTTNMDSENIKVYLRIRPFVDREEGGYQSADPSIGPLSGSLCRRQVSAVQVLDPGNAEDAYHATTVMVNPARTLSASALSMPLCNGGETFSFDAVGGVEVQQEDVFVAVAKSITENCLQGYNGTIFAYGQTGSGKTFTMQGPINEDGSIDYGRRGLIPRIFEYLFARIEEEEHKAKGSLSYFCRCSYVEIYNECIYDLLEVSGSTCLLREDSKRGVYVEGCREEVLSSPEEAFMVFEQGSRNRHVAETAMNRESSRSHCVFMLCIQSRRVDGEIVDVLESRFNLVDLAGSERQQFSATTGLRLKEAGNINKSLLALSNVINALVDIANGKPRHVHYRDSKLTFLLRDSLGGNAKTSIIATVSPSPLCQAETFSTLRFAQRAKQIRNKAIVNKDIQGNLLELQAEIRRLQQEIFMLKTAQRPGGGTSNFEVPFSDLLPLSPGTDAYFMLRVALERQVELNDEVNKGRKQIELLQELVKRKEQIIISERMIVKFRDATIKTLQDQLARNGDVSGLLEVFEEERVAFKKEIAELKKQIESHPEVTRFAYENLTLREKLKQFEDFAHDIASYETILGKHRRYQEALSERILRIEREKEELLQRSSANPTSPIDDIPVRAVRESMDPVPVLVKSDGEEVDLQQRFDQLSKSNSKLEMSYKNLLLEQDILKCELDLIKTTRSASPQHQQQPSECGLMMGEEEEEEQTSSTASLKNFKHHKALTASVECMLDVFCEGENGLGKRRKYAEGEEEEIVPDNSMEELISIQKLLENKVTILQGENTTLKITLEELQKRASMEATHAATLNEDLVQLEANLKQEIAIKTAELDVAISQLENVLGDKDSLEGERSKLGDQVDTLRSTLSQIETKYLMASATLRDAHAELSRNNARIEELERDLCSLTDKLAEYEPLASLGSSTEQICRKIQESDQLQLTLQQRIGKLEFLLEGARADNEQLLTKVTELESQDRESAERLAHLQDAQTTIMSLHAQIDGLQGELLLLRKENDKLIQHNNAKQKLQYHVKIKDENNMLRVEIKKLNDELVKLTQRNHELERLVGEIGKISDGTRHH